MLGQLPERLGGAGHWRAQASVQAIASGREDSLSWIEAAGREAQRQLVAGDWRRLVVEGALASSRSRGARCWRWEVEVGARRPG